MFKILFSLIFVAVTFLISEFILIPFDFYYNLPYLDIPMHVLGGLGFGMILISLLEYFDIKITLKNILIFVLLVGIVWEIYEYIYGILGIRLWGGWIDTVKDLIDDTIGAYISYKICQRSK